MRDHKKPKEEVTPIGHQLDPYEVRIEGYFSDIVDAASETDAVDKVMRRIPPTFTVDEEIAWTVKSGRRPKGHGKHET
jgi:hypothetical protein